MTNLSTLRPPKNSSSKKGKLFTREVASALALGGCEGTPGHLAWLGVTLGEERGFSHFSEGGIGTRGGARWSHPTPWAVGTASDVSKPEQTQAAAGNFPAREERCLRLQSHAEKGQGAGVAAGRVWLQD